MMNSKSIGKNEFKLFSEQYLTETVLTKLLCVIVLSFPIAELICVPFNMPFLLQEMLLKLSGAILLLFFVMKWISVGRWQIRLSDVFLIASAVFAIISIVTSLDIRQSLFGQQYYSETPLQTLGYFMVFLAGTRIKENGNKKKILYAFCGMFLLEMIVGTIQKLQLWPWAAIWGQSRETKPGVAYGLTENSNFYGTLCVLAVGFFASLFLFGIHLKLTKKQYVITYVLSVWAFMCALFSNARLAWVGIAGEGFIFLILALIARKKYGRPISRPLNAWILFLTFVLIFTLFFFFDPVMSKRAASIQKDIQIIKEINGDNIGTGVVNNLGSHRGYIWRVCIEAWKQRPFLGVGFDNLRYAFSMFSDPAMDGYNQGKAHNEYIHYLTTQGILSCLNYMALCLYVVIQGIRDGFVGFRERLHGEKNVPFVICCALLIMVFGYFCQALFSSSVTNIAVYKWIVMGLVLSGAERGSKKECLSAVEKMTK